jgi:TldD protein
MISSIDKGYYLTKSGGGNGSLKGEFNMLVSEGYEIIHGKLGRPIMDTMSAGIAWDALKTVEMVSSNFVNSKNCGTCGKKQSIPTSQGGPEMKLKLNIGGK